MYKRQLTYVLKVGDPISKSRAEMTVYLASPLSPAPALPLLYTYSGSSGKKIHLFSLKVTLRLPSFDSTGPPTRLNQEATISVHLTPDCPGTSNICEYRQETYPHNLGINFHIFFGRGELGFMQCNTYWRHMRRHLSPCKRLSPLTICRCIKDSIMMSTSHLFQASICLLYTSPSPRD